MVDTRTGKIWGYKLVYHPYVTMPDHELCKTGTSGADNRAVHCGIAIKQSQNIKDNYIPIGLGIIGIFLSGIWVVATCPLGSMQEIAMAVFTAVVQGILVAGLSTYVNQVGKQLKKEE